MANLIKKALYTGVGLVATTTERLQKTVDELIEKGKLSQEEGQKVVEDVVKNSEGTKDEAESFIRTIVESTWAKFNLQKNDEIAHLESRVKDLEVKVALLTRELNVQAPTLDEILVSVVVVNVEETEVDTNNTEEII